MSSDKRRTRDFYDSFGWRRAGEKTFKDTAVFVDARPVLDFYKRKVFDRVSKELKREGKYFLDAGSGALPNIHRASRFERLVCVDVSMVGLIEARKKLGPRGWYVVAALAQIPFRDEVSMRSSARTCSIIFRRTTRPERSPRRTGRSGPDSAA